MLDDGADLEAAGKLIRVGALVEALGVKSIAELEHAEVVFGRRRELLLGQAVPLVGAGGATTVWWSLLVNATRKLGRERLVLNVGGGRESVKRVLMWFSKVFRFARALGGAGRCGLHANEGHAGGGCPRAANPLGALRVCGMLQQVGREFVRKRM